MVRDGPSGEVILRHDVGGYAQGWHADRAFLAGTSLVITEVDADDPFGQRTRVFRYELTTGERVQIVPSRLRPAATLEWAVAGGTAAYATKDPETRTSCLVVISLETLEWDERWCASEGWIVDWLRSGPGDTVTFRLQEDGGGAEEPCVRLYRLGLHTTEGPYELPVQDECAAFSGAGGPDWTMWSEVGLRAEYIEDSDGYAQVPDGLVIPMGMVLTGSISACGEWAYWQQYVAESQTTRLVRWRPASGVEILLEAPPDSLMGRLYCSDSWLTISIRDAAREDTVYTISPP